MMDKKILTSHFEFLAKEIKNRKAVLFIGAGLSLNAIPKVEGQSEKFLTWPQLGEKFKEKLVNSKSDLDNISIPKIIQLYEDQFGKPLRNEIIHSAIPDDKFNPVDNSDPDDIYKNLLDPKIFPWQAIVTTNLDTLIERTLEYHDTSYTKIVEHNDFTRIKGIPVYKLHGDLNNQSSYVFSETDYLNFTNKKQIFISKLEQLFAETTFVFFGYSLSDPDLLEIQNRIQFRVGKYSRTSYLFSKNENSYWESYWKNKSIELFNENHLKIINPDYAIFNFPSFLKSSIQVLKESLKEEIDSSHIEKFGEYSWRQNELIPFLNKRTKLEKLKQIYRGISTNVNQREEIKKNKKELFSLLNESLKEIFKLEYFIRESLEEIFYISDDYSGNQVILLFIEEHLIDIGTKEEIDKLNYILESLFKCLEKRIDIGLGFAFDPLNYKSFLKTLLKFYHKLKRKNTKEELEKYSKFIEYYYKFYSLAYISGWGLEEKKVYRVIKNKLVKNKIINQVNLIPKLQYRFAISLIYLNKYRELKKFVNEEIPIIQNWNSKWTAYILYELGDVTEAIKIYETVSSNKSKSIQERYVALQGLFFLRHYKFNWHEFEEESSFFIIKKKELFELEKLAIDKNIYLKDYEVYNKSFKVLEENLSKRAFEVIESQKEKGVIRLGTKDNDLSIFYKTNERLSSLGIPTIIFMYSELRKSIHYFFQKEIYFPQLVELSLILPILKDYSKFNLVEIISKFVWKHPDYWITLQNELFRNYKEIIEFVIESDFNKSNNSQLRPIDRLNKIVEIIGIAAHWFSEINFDKFLKFTIEMIDKNNQRLFTNNQDDSKLFQLINTIFNNISQEEKIKLFQKFEPQFWLSYSGYKIFQSIQDLLPMNFWNQLSKSYKDKFKNSEYFYAEYRLDIFFFFLKNKENRKNKEFQSLYSIISTILEEYRKEQIEYHEKLSSNPDFAESSKGEVEKWKTRKDKFSVQLDSINKAENLVVYEFDSLIQKLELIVAKGGSGSNDMRILFEFKDMNLSEEQINQIRLNINLYLEKENVKIHFTSNPFGTIYKDSILLEISAFYFKFKQFEDWFLLFEKYGCKQFYFHSEEEINFLRDEYEINKDSSLSVTRITYLLHSFEDSEKNNLLYLLRVFYQRAKIFTKSDFVLLDFLWYSDYFKLAMHSVFNISLIALKLNKEVFEKRLNIYLRKLNANYLEMKIYSNWASRFLEFMDKIRKEFDLDEEFKIVFNQIEKKIKKLNLPKEKD